MADLSQFIEATSALAINEILAPIRDDEGIALPSKYEVIFFPPSGTRGSGGAGATSNLFSQIMFGNIGRGEQRDISMQCNKIEFPGRNPRHGGRYKYLWSNKRNSKWIFFC